VDLLASVWALPPIPDLVSTCVNLPPYRSPCAPGPIRYRIRVLRLRESGSSLVADERQRVGLLLLLGLELAVQRVSCHDPLFVQLKHNLLQHGLIAEGVLRREQSAVHLLHQRTDDGYMPADDTRVHHLLIGEPLFEASPPVVIIPSQTRLPWLVLAADE